MGWITLEEFEWSKPDLINEEDYFRIKKEISYDSNYLISPKISIFKEFVYQFSDDLLAYSIAIIILLLGGLIEGIFGSLSTIQSNFWSVIVFIISLPILYAWFLLAIRLIFTYPTFIISIYSRNNYYNKLKRKVKNSKNYLSFLNSNRIFVGRHPNYKSIRKKYS